MKAGDPVLWHRAGIEPRAGIVLEVHPGMVKVQDAEDGRTRNLHPRWVMPA